MGYVRSEQKSTVLSVEQARRRNAELRRELAGLTVENTHLEAQVGTMRLRVSEARRKLTGMTRQLDVARSQAERLGKVVISPAPLSEPLYGGREGLEAATAEMEAFESRGLKLSKAREPGGLSHGTGRRYEAGCRCEACVAWRKRKSAQGLANYHARQARKKAA